MSPGSEVATQNFPSLLGIVTDDAIFHDDVSELSASLNMNGSLGKDCVQVIFSDMDFLPWDNADNIVSAEVEDMTRMVKNVMLGFLYLIGGPANVINMAVFSTQGLKYRVNLCLFVLSLMDGLYLTAAILFHGEQLRIQFTTKEIFGPIATLITNLNLTILLAPFCYVSPVLSAIIATERCICVFWPLKFQNLLRTRTMMVIIIIVCILVFGLFFIVTFRYRIGCVHDPVSDVVINTVVEGEFYRDHKELIDAIESSVFGVGLPGTAMTVVTIMTIMTIIKLRQVMSWRSETTSSISAKEVALTKMLVGNSILFIVCTSPFALVRFSWLFFPEVNPGRRMHNFFLTGIWVGETFTYINASFNIFVYYIMGSHFRETFWTIFSRRPQLQKH